MPARKTKGGARKGGNKNNTPVNWNQPMTKKQKSSRARQVAQMQQRNEQSNQSFPRGRQPRNQVQVGNAIRVRIPTVGMSDLIQHRITWVAGTVYVGNGTLGATNSIYAATQAANATYAAGSGGGFWIPFAPADSDVGSTYGASLMKLYRRVRIRKAKVHLLTIQSSTTNNAVICVAPIRGPPGANELAAGATGTGAAQTLQNLMSVSGMQTCDSFENLTLDLTPYIASGSGSQQNEFAIANTVASGTEISQTPNLLGAIATGFQIAGNSTVTALQGSVTHNIVCEMVCDLFDFVGAIPTVDPEEFLRRRTLSIETKEEKRARLLNELSAIARDDKGKRDLSPSPSGRP